MDSTQMHSIQRHQTIFMQNRHHFIICDYLRLDFYLIAFILHLVY